MRGGWKGRRAALCGARAALRALAALGALGCATPTYRELPSSAVPLASTVYVNFHHPEPVVIVSPSGYVDHMYRVTHLDGTLLAYTPDSVQIAVARATGRHGERSFVLGSVAWLRNSTIGTMATITEDPQRRTERHFFAGLGVAVLVFIILAAGSAS